MSKPNLHMVHRTGSDAIEHERSFASLGFPLPRKNVDDPADRHGTYSEHYDPQFVVGMLLLLRSMVHGLNSRRTCALLQRASALADLHGRFVKYRSGFVVFQPDDGPELMLQDDIQRMVESREGSL